MKISNPTRSLFYSIFLFLLFSVSLLTATVFAAVETEPNNKLGIANGITQGVPITADFALAGDQDWYAITLDSPGRLECSVTDLPANIRAYITVYNRHADYAYVYNGAINEGDDVFLTYDVLEPGTYYIKLNDRDNDSSDETYTFTADFTAVTDIHEPNNQLGQASLVAGTSITGIVFGRGDEDWYKIYADASDTLNLTIDPPNEMRPNITLYGPNANYLYVYKTAVNSGETIALSHTVTEAGFYYIRITDAEALGHTKTYSLSVSGGTPGFTPTIMPVTTEAEDNGKFGWANPVPLDASVISGLIGSANDEDWYRFDVSQVGQLTVELTSVPTNLAMRFRLYNSSGGQIQSGQPTSAGGLFSLIYDVTAPDIYYLLVDDLDNEAFSSTAYTFTVSLVEVADAFEPNDNYGDTTVLSQINRVKGYVFKTGDSDWFRISVAQAGDLRVVLSDLPENITPQVDLYNLSKEHLAGKGGTAGMDMELIYTVPEPGDYLVLVRDGGNNDESTQPYTMTIHGADFATFAPTARIEQIDPGSIVHGNSISFSGSGIDSDGVIAAYSWRSSIDGALSSESAFSTSALSMGTHTVYFKVQDDDGIWSTEVSEVVYVGSTVSDEVENNGEIGFANEIALSQPVNAKINAAGDHDFFRIYISRPGRLNCTVTNVPDNLRLYLTYYGRHLNYLYITDAAAQDGDDVSLAMNVTEPGFIYLRVYDRDNEFNADFTYTLTADFEEAVDPQEPNDSMLDSFTMTGTTASGYIFPNGDQDWYKVWVDAGGTLTAQVTNTPANLRPYVTLYGRNCEYLYSYNYADNDGDNTPLLSHTFDKAGFVYVKVNDRDSDYNWNQKYTLTLTGANPGYQPVETPVAVEIEDNGVFADANLVSLGTSVSASMGTAGDDDWFKFYVPSAGIIHSGLESVPEKMRTRIRIWRDDNGYIDGRNATNPGDLISLDTAVTRPGIYRVLIDDLDENISEVPYILSIAFTSAADAHEPNGNFGDAATLQDRNRTQGWIFDQGDEDWYQVACESGSVLQVTVADVPAEIRSQIDVYNSSGSWCAGKTATNYGQSLTLSYTTNRTAVYYFRIRHAGNNSYSTSPYTLIVNGANFSSYTPLALIDSVLPNPADAGETVTLEGHGEDADGEIIGYEWRSSLDGLLSSSRVAEVASLSAGQHGIYFKVKDNDQNWSPETETVLYFGVPAPQEEEPNDEIGSATPMDLDTQYTGIIDPGNDIDFFRIYVGQPGTLTISATNPTGSLMRTYLGMYTPNADWAYVSTSANGEGDPVTLTWNITESGYYFLRVDDNDNNAGAQYTVTATLQTAPDPYELNPDPTHATSVKIGDMLQGYIFPGGDQDWYKVTLAAPGTLHMSLTNMPDNLRGYITVYDRNTNYSYVYTSAEGDGDNVYLDYNVTEPGTYFIKIHDRDNEFNALAAYTFLTGFDAAPDPFEPNGDFWHSATLTKSPANAYIFPGGDQDWYRFYAENGSDLAMTVDDTPSNLRPYLTLYNDNLGYMYKTATTDVEGESVTLAYRAEYTGYYYLKVHDRDGDWSSTSTYRLSVTGADLSYQSGSQPVTEETEPNNAFSSATLVAAGATTGTFGGDDDWYRFEVTGRTRLTLGLTSPSVVRSVIRIYNANYSERASRYAENAGDFSQFSYDIDEPGIWYVRIYADGGTVSADPYELQVTLDAVPDPFEPNPDYAQATPLTFGEPLQAYIFPAGDQDWFRMETSEPGTIQFMLENVPSSIEISMALNNQNNSQLFAKESLNYGTGLKETFVAEEAGTYYLRIYDRGNDETSLAPYSLTATFTPFVDQLEPNDSFSQATVLDEKNQISGFIYPEGDEDWYTFMVTETGLLSIQMAETTGIRPHIWLYTDSKGYLTEMTSTEQGDDLLMTCDITVPDRYYLRIRSEDSVHSLTPYLLTIRGGSFGDYYPLAAIDDMSPNPAITGDPVALSGSGTDEGGAIVAYEWASDIDGALGNGSEVNLPTLSEGSHRISFRVQDNSGKWSGWVHKSLYVTDSIVSESEYNDNIEGACPVPLSTWITGQIYPRYDDDYYKIYIEERGYLSTLVDATPTDMRAYIAFYDGYGGYMYRTASANNFGDWFRYDQFLEAGWYYVRVEDRDGLAYDRTYAIRFDHTPARDVHEPNDELASATSIPADHVIDDAYICRQGDVDWYRITVDQVGRLSLSITQAPPAMRGYITIYDANASYSYVYLGASHDGEDVFLDYDVTSPGTYYVKVNDRDNEAHTAPYTFTSAFTAVDDIYEYNDNAGHSTLMPKTAVDAFIFPRGDEDWYRIYASKDETLSMAVTDNPSGMRANITVYGRDVNYTYNYQTANNEGDNVYLTYTAPSDGFYYIRVTDSNSGSYVSPYRFTLEGGTLDYEPPFAPVASEQEPNGTFGEANDISLDTSMSGTIDPGSDYDWYRFYINTPGIVTISHTDIPAGFKSEMWIYNGSYSQIGYRITTETGVDNILVMTINEAGYYRVRLRDNTQTGSISAYRLRVNHQAVVDGNEPNDDFGPATPLGQGSVQGYLFDEDDEDWYRIYVRDASTVAISLDVVPEGLRPRVILLDSNKSQQSTYVNTNPGVGGEDVIVYDDAEPGFYFVRVYDEDNGYSASPYTLSISGADFSSAPLLASIGDRTIDETMEYAFVVTATDPDNFQNLLFSATGLPPGAAFDPATRTFSWTPARGQGGVYSGIHFEVSDGTFTDSEDITITVTGLSRAPVLAPIGNKVASVGGTLSFQISGTDPDTSDVLTYSAGSMPSGATFDPATRTFSWTPSTNQVGLYTSILFEVTDGTWTDFEYININVSAVEPTVITGDVSNISETGANAGGNVTSTGGANITERGFVYALHSVPTVDDLKAAAGSIGTGSFSVTLQGLAPSTGYYLRAYAINSVGVSYGEEKSFVTLTPAAPAITITPELYNFGAVPQGTNSSAQVFTVRNTGNAGLAIDTVRLTGTNAAEFTLRNDYCSGQVIVSGGTGTIEVVFSPVSTGAKAASLSIPSNDPRNQTLLVPLAGEGLEKSVLKGDINDDGQVDLTDAILALQVVMGIVPSATIEKHADVNGDGRIGIQEALYILRDLSGTSGGVSE